MLNKYGLTPLQVAAYKNNTEMVGSILKWNRVRFWKWGERAFYGYPLNEVDGYFKSAEETPGIPVHNIILCEKNVELLGVTLIEKLIKEKWSKFGKLWARLSFVYQLVFCGFLTYLFMLVRPHLDNMDRGWGMNYTPGGIFSYIVVLLKVGCDMICGMFEWWTLRNEYVAREREILQQRMINEKLRDNPFMKLYTEEEEEINAQVSSEMKCSICTIVSLYFEKSISIPPEFHKMKSKKRKHSYVTELFTMISYLSNTGFIIAQVAFLLNGISAARVLLISMIFIMICEYAQLFLWLQTWSQVGRFISAFVNILRKDLIGFAIVFLIVQLVFSICFLLLSEEDNVHNWWIAFFIFYELSIGTGEWFKENLDAIEKFVVYNDSVVCDPNYDDTVDNDFLPIDPYRKAYLYFIYMIHICINLVILMNLLIAVMSETASSFAKELRRLEQSLKLSAVSLVSRRLRTYTSIAKIVFRCKSFSDKCDDYTIGFATAEDSKLFAGRFPICDDTLFKVRQKSLEIFPQINSDRLSTKEYFNKMRWWTVLEHEPMEYGGDTKKSSEQKSLGFYIEKVKEYLSHIEEMKTEDNGGL